MQPVIRSCWDCGSEVFEFEDNHFGCDKCKAIWTYNGKQWDNVAKNRKRKRINHGRNIENNGSNGKSSHIGDSDG